MSSLSTRPEIVHALPGRVRVYLPSWSGGGQRRIEQRLRRVPGVQRVQANSLTRNVLLCFDPQQVNEKTLLAALETAADDASDLPEDEPLPHVVDERHQGSIHRARIAVPGLELDPAVAGRVVRSLEKRLGVRAWASPLIGRVMVEYDEHRTDLEEVLACVVGVDLPDLPGEDRPAHPLDRAP